MKSNLRAYRMSSVEGATHLDVLLACYDALAEDIRLAGEAAGVGDFTARCRYSQHALLVLGQLQNWVPLLENEILGGSLSGFYEYLRKKLLCLQSCVESHQFSDLAMSVCETRAVWQKKKSLLLSSEIPTASEGQSTPSNSVDGRRLHCSA